MAGGTDGYMSLNSNFDSRIKYEKGRGIGVLFFGIVVGFVFSFMVAYQDIMSSSYVADPSYSTDRIAMTSEPEFPADILFKEVRVLCLVLSSAGGLKERAPTIINTWGRRCNKIVFISDELNEQIPLVIKLDYGTFDTEYKKMREAYKYIYKHNLNDFDWILKAKDDSYVVMENLRHMLYQYEANWAIQIGQRYLTQDYLLGDYALSKKAFTQLLENAFTNHAVCDPNAPGYSDLPMDRCLKHVNVLQIDSIDKNGRGQFFKEALETVLFPVHENDDDKYFWHKFKQGAENCCSDKLVSIQGHGPLHLYYLEYFIYKVHAFGVKRIPEPLPKKFKLEEILKYKS